VVYFQGIKHNSNI